MKRKGHDWSSSRAVQIEACVLLLVMPELMLSSSLALCSLIFPVIFACYAVH